MFQTRTRCFIQRKEPIDTRMFNLKALSSRIRVPANKMVKDLTIKHRRKLFCKYDGVWYQFPSVNEVIIPYKQAKDYTLLAHKNLPNPVDVNDLSYDHLLDATKDKIPAVVLLGHFNHGKTTLLDTLGGTTFVDEEKHSITQTIRTMLVSTSATKRITIVDTPGKVTTVHNAGQEVFYRMRSYGASIADLALLLVAADDGIGLQTEESIGILEELGLPVIVCINKIDTVKSPDRLRKLEKQIREYEALENAPIVQISARERLNIKVLLEKLEALSGTAQLKSLTGASSKEGAQADSDALNIIGAGTVLNILKNRQQGVALHVIIRHGEVRAGDWFSAGGWSGAVRSLQHSIPPTPSNNTKANTAAKSKGKPSTSTTCTAVTATAAPEPPVFPQIPLKDPTVASAGMAVTMLVTLHPEGNDPRPIGDTVRFHRDASVIRKERKQKQSGISAQPAAENANTSSTDIAKTTQQQSHVKIMRKIKDVPAEQFSTAKEAAAYCMDRNQLEVKLAGYAISPHDAARFGLERLSTLFQKQKPGFRSEARTNRVIDAEQREDDAAQDLSGDSDGDTDADTDGADEEEGSDSDGNEGDEGEEEEEEEDDGKESGARTVVVKADSDITLGTLYDKYHDVAAARKAAAEDADHADNSLPPLCEVLHWGIGEVGIKDVNLASAGDALIIAYNVGVERSAARQALNLNVKIAKFDHIQEAADIISTGDLTGNK